MQERSPAWIAMARPMPNAPPVTTTTFSARACGSMPGGWVRAMRALATAIAAAYGN